MYYAETPAQPIVVSRSATEGAYWNGVWTGRAEAVAAVATVATLYGKIERGRSLERDEEPGLDDEQQIDFARELKETRALMAELTDELNGLADRLAASIERPTDGVYLGETCLLYTSPSPRDS